MPPSQEGLGPADPAASDVDDRLVMQDQLFIGQRLSQPVLQRKPLKSPGVHGRRVKLVVVASFLLRSVQGDIGILDERLGVQAVIRVHADADAGRDENVPLLDGERIPNALEKFRRDFACVLLRRDPCEENDELVSPQARDGISSPYARLQPLGDAAQQLVSGGVTEGVVDHLEPVEVQEQSDQLLAASARLREGDRQPVVEEQAVRKSRQGVVEREMFDLLFRALSFGDVDDRPFDHRAVAIGALHQRRVLEDPYRSAVPLADAGFVIGEAVLLAEPREKDVPVLRTEV